MKRKQQNCYSVGVVPHAGLKVLEVLYQGPLQSDVRYRVEFTCCGFVCEISHAAVRERERRNAQYCMKCVGGKPKLESFNLGMSSRDHGITPPA